MAIFEVAENEIKRVNPTTFSEEKLQERADLQRLLRDQIEIVAPEVLVVSEEFGDWDESRRRIDLLGIDRDANIVVIELKRTNDGGHMELQAVRYAAMVSTLTAAGAVEIYGSYLEQRGREGNPESKLLEFLGWDGLDEEKFGQDVRIVLVSADFSRELTTALMWLNEKDLDIRCVRIQPYAYSDQVLIDVQQVVPLPESADYQVQVKNKKRKERDARQSNVDFTRFDITINGQVHQSQWKRNAILLVVKALLERGTSPEDVRQILAPVRSHRLWHSVSGEVTEIEVFTQTALAAAEADGRRFDSRRWHTHEGDLFTHSGKTYVFSNQWGDKRWAAAMKLLTDHCPEAEITWAPSGSDKQ